MSMCCRSICDIILELFWLSYGLKLNEMVFYINYDEQENEWLNKSFLTVT